MRRQGRSRILTCFLTAAWQLLLLVISSKGSAAKEVAASTRTIRTSSQAEADLSNTLTVDDTMLATPPRKPHRHDTNSTEDPFWRLEQFRDFRRQAAEARKNRYKLTRQERQQKARDFAQKLPKAPQGKIERVSPEDLEKMEQQQQGRGLNWWGSGGATSDAYSSSVLVDPSQYYDKWAQAYRMLGGYIDCDHDKSGDSHDDNGNNGGNDACSRWMLWAAYVNPNYQGNEYYEYFGDNPTSVLDCHNPDSDWQLLGVYRQEFYQYIEQISKHLWAVDEYEYVVALAGLSYMTEYECFYVGNDSSGNYIYASVAPKPYGKFQMALYTDDGFCMTPNDSLGMTYDDFGLTSDVNLGSKDDNDDYSSYYEWWSDAQEYTLTNLNEVYEEFKYCTSCVDYPTYQDGFFIGDYGTDDDDLINQCWKFYSHDSYTCEAECIAMAHAQGTILSIKYGDSIFGSSMASFYAAKSANGESRFSRLLANVFLTASFLLFVATFLAFAVARRSRYRESRSSKSRRLLDDDRGDRSRRSHRSKSRRREGDDDGLFRTSPSSKSPSKSRSKRSSSGKKHRSHSKSRDKSRQRSSSRHKSGY